MGIAQLFVTCLVDTFAPEVGTASLALLQRAGVRVDFPQAQTCCGQPMFNAGLRIEARRAAENFIRTFEAVEGDIVMPSGSCAHMIRHNYGELFEGEAAWDERVRHVAARTFELTEYLVDVLGVTDCKSAWRGSISYHPTCHLHRGLGVDRQPRTLLNTIRAAEVLDLPEGEDCCGFGGIFSVEHPELSAEMLKRKIANLEKSGASTLVACDTGCLLHLRGGLHRAGIKFEVRHIAEILAQE